MQAFCQSRSPQQFHRVIGVVSRVHFEAHDLAAVHIQDQVQVIMPDAA
jgi:hypothetical protein